MVNVQSDKIKVENVVCFISRDWVWTVDSTDVERKQGQKDGYDMQQRLLSRITQWTLLLYGMHLNHLAMRVAWDLFFQNTVGLAQES